MLHSFLHILAVILAIVSVLASFMIVFRLKQPISPVWWVVKAFITALVPFFALAAILSILLGMATGSLWPIVTGFYSILVFLLYFYRVKKAVYASTGFTHAYGPDWENQIKPGLKKGFLSNPLCLTIPDPEPSAYLLKQDIPFCTLPGTTRDLLCDVWTPSESIERSGLAFIYFHGSAWGMLDKDFGTRPFFKHLVSRGHVIMDVAYRLFPETDMTGMVNDIHRAVAWMKNQATDLQVRQDRIVIGGASAGGHLSLLAAYGTNPSFVPAELQGVDLSVHAVVSEYGPTDLQAMYYHTGQNIVANQPKKSQSGAIPAWVQNKMGKNFHRLGMDKDVTKVGMLSDMLGDSPDKCADVYANFSPLKQVHKNCPQTLIIQGTHDIIAPVDSTIQLYQRLNEEGVKVALYLIPQTDHAFDLILPRISPAAHTAFYLIERFLALQVSN